MATDVTPIGSKQPVAVSLPMVVSRIVEALDPEKIILFGSYAYGSPTPDSDVDLLVIWDTPLVRGERYLAVSRLIRPRPFPVDILVRTPDEVGQALARGNTFMREATKRGQILYERRSRRSSVD